MYHEENKFLMQYIAKKTNFWSNKGRRKKDEDSEKFGKKGKYKLKNIFWERNVSQKEKKIGRNDEEKIIFWLHTSSKR